MRGDPCSGAGAALVVVNVVPAVRAVREQPGVRWPCQAPGADNPAAFDEVVGCGLADAAAAAGAVERWGWLHPVAPSLKWPVSGVRVTGVTGLRHNGYPRVRVNL
jgi:hypothetical protein